MKIAVLIDLPVAGGVQSAAIEEVKSLTKLGHDATLVVLYHSRPDPAFVAASGRLRVVFLSLYFHRFLQKDFAIPPFHFLSLHHFLSPLLAPLIIPARRFDLIISHNSTTSATAFSLNVFRKIPYRAIVHDPLGYTLKKVYAQTFLRHFFWLLYPAANVFEKIVLSGAGEIFVDSPTHAELVAKICGRVPKSVPLGTNIHPRFPSKSGGGLLALSRWQTEKNPVLLLKILNRIPKAKLVIAGTWTNPKHLEEFKNLVVGLNLAKRVTLLPMFNQSSLRGIFQKSLVWIHPNLEAFGLAGLEAAAHGLPIIIPSGSGVASLFTHGVEGFFPKDATVDSFFPYVARLVANKRLARRMGQRAYQTVKYNYTWDIHTQKLLQ